jgi:hypothetical protein
MDEGGSTNAVFLSGEALCGWPLGRVPLLGTLEGMLSKGSGYSPLSLHMGPTGEPGGDSLAGTFERKG